MIRILLSRFNFFVLCISFLSCKTYRWIPVKYQSNIVQRSSSMYCNSHLKFAFVPDGYVKAVQPKSMKGAVPAEILDDLRKSNDLPQKKIAFILSNTLMWPMEIYSIGIIEPFKKSYNNLDTSNYGAVFSIDTSMIIADSFYKVVSHVPTKEKDIKVIFYQIKSKKIKHSKNFVYRYEWFKYLMRYEYKYSLKTDENFNCIDDGDINTYYADSVRIYDGQYVQQLNMIKGVLKNYYNTLGLSNAYEHMINHFSFLTNLDSVKYYKHRRDSVLTYKFNQINISANNIIGAKTNTNAEEYILAVARKNRVLMFNECHWDWRNRWLITLLLDSLYKIGYRSLALEALEKDDSLEIRKYPLQKNGFYVREPYMANLIRQALKKGFKLIAYEDTTNSGDRDFMQAVNLYNAIKKDSTKVIVLAGYDHIEKDSVNSIATRMGYHLKNFLGQSPYTINQTTYNSIFYSNISLGTMPEDYYCLNVPVQDYKKADMYIVNNVMHQPYEMPGVISNSFKYIISLPNSIIKQDSAEQYYIFIYVKNELEKYKEKAIPVYVKSFISNYKQPIVYLPAGEYSYIIQNERGVNILQEKLNN